MNHSTLGIVLSKQVFGEADLYVTFLTKDHGIITTLAKAARKSKRRYIGGLDLFCHDEIFFRGAPHHHPYLIELSVKNTFAGIREDLTRLTLAGKMLKWILKLSKDLTSLSLYPVLGQSLASLEKIPSSKSETLWLTFKLKLLSVLGLQPKLDSCVKCDNTLSEISHFDFSAGGTLCELCSKKGDFFERIKMDVSDRAFLIKLSQSSFKDIFMLNEYSLIPSLNSLITQFTSYHSHSHLPY